MVVRVAKTYIGNVSATRRHHTAEAAVAPVVHEGIPAYVKPGGHGVIPIAPMVVMGHRAVPANQTPVTLKFIK